MSFDGLAELGLGLLDSFFVNAGIDGGELEA
jgi:hypothetical protein